MESGSDGGVTVAQFFVAVWLQFAGEARRAAAHVALAVAEPKTQEYLALNTEGYVVVAERLVFCDAMQRQRKVSHLLNVHTNRLLSMFLLLTVEALHLHAELIGKDSVEEDADDSSESQTREGYRTDLHTTVCAVLHADRHNHDERCHEHVARRREVDRCLDKVAHTYCRNHTVENEAHAADCSGWHQTDEAGELRAEAEHDGEAGCKADDSRVEHLGKVEHTGVLAVCGVGRSAEHRSEERSKTIAAERAVQARFLDEVLAHSALDSTHVANVLHDCGEGDREDGDDRRHDKVEVGVFHYRDCRTIHINRQTNPRHLIEFGEVDLTHCCSQDIRSDNAEQDWHNLDDALAPDRCSDDDNDGRNGKQPVLLTVADSRSGERKTDSDNHRTGNHRREEAHHLLRAEHLQQERHHEIEQRRRSHTDAGIVERHLVCQTLRHAQLLYRGIAAKESEARTEECGHLQFGNKMEDECADTGEKQCGTHIESGDERNENCGSEHGEQMLDAENCKLGLAQLAGIIYALVVCVHTICLFLVVFTSSSQDY